MHIVHMDSSCKQHPLVSSIWIKSHLRVSCFTNIFVCVWIFHMSACPNRNVCVCFSVLHFSWIKQQQILLSSGVTFTLFTTWTLVSDDFSCHRTPVFVFSFFFFGITVNTLPCCNIISVQKNAEWGMSWVCVCAVALWAGGELFD